ncbi:hypothetical protein HDF19_08450 [Mucilaginibacter sp. E4BP6]|uniref:hypothetical protein n=1 Tax=Mucilaginibacter sp. E4BP6 TaxID=2723089 RepID=UPI0015C83739|nr:hypothetical protein [Mucilaginibacter sp. E4BP6]NYE68615.1 hypothetical protein [Mucilaginibacter sp. E4BP6]
MLKKILFITLLSIAGMNAHAQGGYIQYEPIPSQAPPPPPEQQPTYQPQQQQPVYQQQYYQQPTSEPQGQLTYGYIIKSTGYRKVSLKVIYSDKAVYITAVKELSATYWTNLTTSGATGQKLMYNEDYSDKFEYKVYLPVLGEVVYF